MMPVGIKVPGFSKLSNQIGYILLKHSVQFETYLIYSLECLFASYTCLKDLQSGILLDND